MGADSQDKIIHADCGPFAGILYRLRRAIGLVILGDGKLEKRSRVRQYRHSCNASDDGYGASSTSKYGRMVQRLTNSQVAFN